jgi:hypothetical protein
MNKKRTSRRVNNKNHHEKTKTLAKEYQLVGSIEDSEEQTEHATIEQDTDYWTRETIGGPAQYDEEIYKALYLTDEEVKEMFARTDEEMFSNDDGFFTDDEDIEEIFATDDGFLTNDLYLNMNGTTQSANPQGQEIKTTITYKEVEEMFSNDDGFFTDDLFSTGNLQSTKRHESVILLKHTVTEAPLLCRPNVIFHPSRKYLKPRPRLRTKNKSDRRTKQD